MLAVFVLGDRLLFAPIEPYEIDQWEYSRLMDKLLSSQPYATYLIPWISDYSFLRIAYPDERIYLTISKAKSGGDEFFKSKPFLWWAGEQRYVGSLDTLTSCPQPWIYTGWTYSPVILEMREMLKRVGIDSFKENDYKNHLTWSWVWSHPALDLKNVAEIGPYYAFVIQFLESRIMLDKPE
jgi:hypothetical protein